MADNQVETEPVRPKNSKRRLSASEYQKYILEEHGMEVDSRGEVHLAEHEDNDVFCRIPSWLLISDSKSTTDQDLCDAYNHIENAQHQQQQQANDSDSVLAPSKWQRYRAEICDLFRELYQYGKNKSWKKKVLTVIVFCSSILVLHDLIFVGNIYIWLQEFILWMGDHIVEGIFAFIGIFVITTRAYIVIVNSVWYRYDGCCSRPLRPPLTT
jgi:hypothetical protein